MKKKQIEIISISIGMLSALIVAVCAIISLGSNPVEVSPTPTNIINRKNENSLPDNINLKNSNSSTNIINHKNENSLPDNTNPENPNSSINDINNENTKISSSITSAKITKSMISYRWISPALKSFGLGDSDVCTKEDRRTDISILINNFRVIDNKILIHVFYDIKEMHPDNTNLRYDGNVSIPLSSDLNGKIIKLQSEIRDVYNFNTSKYGCQHNWFSITDNLENTIIESANAKIDGEGDDLTNAALEINFSIPITITDNN